MDRRRRSDIPRIQPPSDRCQLLFKGRRLAGLIMAVPFVICFALFGIFNLIAGSVLSAMAWKPRFNPSVLKEVLLREHSSKIETLLDPLKIIGPILLITGAMLVIDGIVLGIIACRSVQVQRPTTGSGMQLSSVNGPTSVSRYDTALRFPKRTLSVPNNKSPEFPSLTTRVTIEVHQPPVNCDPAAQTRTQNGVFYEEASSNLPTSDSESDIWKPG